MINFKKIASVLSRAVASNVAQAATATTSFAVSAVVAPRAAASEYRSEKDTRLQRPSYIAPSQSQFVDFLCIAHYDAHVDFFASLANAP